MSLNVTGSVIESFLNGSNPKEYVVSIEAGYNNNFVYLITNDPAVGKRIEKHSYKPFLWFKHDVIGLLYGGKKLKQMEAAKKFGIKTKKLRVTDENGDTPPRLVNGYRYTATCSRSYNDLVNFFKEGGVNVFEKQFSKLFFMFAPAEQFMIQTGIRMFKGMDDYNELHRFQFDLETEGLLPSKSAIFQIGIRDNRGFEEVLESKGATAQERRDSERTNIIRFFQIINEIKPDVITGYNSESFDWGFFYDRGIRLSLPLEQIAFGLDGTTRFKRKPAMLKLGNEMEPYLQTHLWGYNILDIAHSVRRAQSINSDIKSWSLKYITQYSEIAKKNRVYVPGDKINTIWADKENQYAFNDVNGDWYRISERMPLKENYQIVGGDYIVQRYLLDDLWETEQIDNIFNQASFLISKLLPTNYSRSSTMGTASQWKLIMAAWSYENELAIPETEPKRDFTGGLSRLLELGYARNVVKLDYAALYPKSQLTHEVFPNLDISGVMKGLLEYIVDTRDKFKFLTDKHKKIVKKLKAEYDANKDTYTPERLTELEAEIDRNKVLQNLYDKKQLPLKILANSWFGAYGAPYIFNWGDSDCAEETTCLGRQYLRLMVKHFHEKHGFKPLVGDTDGFNFSFPDNINEFKYVAKGSHWKTTENAGEELSGLDAVLAEFNETYMFGRMGLDIDDICNSTINFSRKNYANDINGKIKFVGNSIKSKKMPVYIEDFLGKAIRHLLDGNGKAFINLYYDHVDKIYNYNIPMVKIASKSKVKSNISDYKKRATKKNKAGNPLPKQAHMELAIQAGVDVNLGDVLYYVNTGKAKSHGDLKTVKKENGMIEIQLNCKLIDPAVVESDMEKIKELETLRKILAELEPDQTEKIEELQNEIEEKEGLLYKEDYNVAKYLEAFNKKVKPLLVCFHPDVRNKILLGIKKEKKTKIEKLTERNIFTDAQCQLVSGMPNKEGDQDSYLELMTMEDKEIKFWIKVNKVPINMELDVWEEIQVDYHERKRLEKINGIETEKKYLDDMFKRLEFDELKKIKTMFVLPDDIILLATVNENYEFVSRKWDTPLADINDIFKYEKEAIQRSIWYQMQNLTKDDRYEQWMEYQASSDEYVPIDVVLSGDSAPVDMTEKIEQVIEHIEIFEKTRPKLKSNKKVITENDSDSDDDDEAEEDNKRDEEIILEAEVEDRPDLDGLVPDGFSFTPTEEPVEEENDEVAEEPEPPVIKPRPISKEVIKVSFDEWNF